MKTGEDAMSSFINQEMEKESQRRFEAFANVFFHKWQPKDPLEAQRFSAEFFSLVRQIFIDAQQPLIEQMSALSMLIKVREDLRP